MSIILIFSSLSYIHHFKSIHGEPEIIKDATKLRDELAIWDKYFQNFFNWSITNQWILFGIIIAEIILIMVYGKRIGEHFWFLLSDTLVILIEIGLLRKFRKRMMDLEMDYNVFVPGKIFFVNQSGILSTIQTIDGDKVKTVQSIFPSKIASFFNYGTVHVLTEWDTAMIGTMNMYYVTNPDKAVAHIQELISIEEDIKWNTNTKPSWLKEIDRHSIDTREKIRDVLR